MTDAVHVEVSAEHGWILQDIAHVGFMRTSHDGRILEANAHAARLCGYASPQSLVEARTLPEPLTLLADGDASAPARFEVCLQLTDGQAPRRVAGARLPSREGNVTWLLASAADLERCLTALVTSARDALPLGGRLSLSVHTPGAPQALDLSEVRRLDAHLVLEAQGYGLTTFELPATLRELAAGFGGALEVEYVDGLTARVSLHVPRAFVVSHAA